MLTRRLTSHILCRGGPSGSSSLYASWGAASYATKASAPAAAPALPLNPRLTRPVLVDGKALPRNARSALRKVGFTSPFWVCGEKAEGVKDGQNPTTLTVPGPDGVDIERSFFNTEQFKNASKVLPLAIPASPKLGAFPEEVAQALSAAGAKAGWSSRLWASEKFLAKRKLAVQKGAKATEVKGNKYYNAAQLVKSRALAFLRSQRVVRPPRRDSDVYIQELISRHCLNCTLLGHEARTCARAKASPEKLARNKVRIEKLARAQLHRETVEKKAEELKERQVNRLRKGEPLKNFSKIFVRRHVNRITWNMKKFRRWFIAKQRAEAELFNVQQIEEQGDSKGKKSLEN